MADIPISCALLSVFDKNLLIPFAQLLSDYNVKLLSTGGTARALTEAGLEVTDVSDYTGFPEMMDGRVKSLNPLIHGGILARRNDEAHCELMTQHNIIPIDLVVSNLYPFEEIVRKGAEFSQCIENIDIGGPALIRSAAKNHEFVTVVTDPQDYEFVMKEMQEKAGATTVGLRKRLAATAFERTAAYDALIARWLQKTIDNKFPRRFTFTGNLKQILRYGENPHQAAAFYSVDEEKPSISTARQVQGKELSYNNLNDTNAAFELACEFNSPSVVFIKHTSPCGVAESDTLIKAYQKALACDPLSAFGSVIATNRPLDLETAQAISELFVEVVIAPNADEEALTTLKKRKNLRLLFVDSLVNPQTPNLNFNSIPGGFLIQETDSKTVNEENLKVVTKRAPSKSELLNLLFANKIVKHAKSNAIVYARDSQMVGLGAGQMSRVDAAHLAAWKASQHLGSQGSVVASDAFFPFPDGLQVAIEAGATAAIQPGGSLRDDNVIAAADDANIAMVFTDIRHFRH